MAKLGAKEPSQRQLKVGEELRHLLSDIFMRGDFYDPDTHKNIEVTVSEVRISPDLKNATVYVIPLSGTTSDADKNKTVSSLQSFSSQIRRTVSKKIRMRHIPFFTFKLDDCFETASKINNLLNSPEVQRDIETQ